MSLTRVALGITELEIGGAEQNLVELATRLDRSRFLPEVYCLAPRPTDLQRSCVPALEAAAVPVHFLDGRRWWHVPRVLARWTELLRKQQPHLLQTFLFHANLLGRHAARRAGVPLVLAGIRVAERQSRWHLWLDRRSSGQVDRYVCVSNSVARFSVAHGLPKNKLVVIPNGIDASRYPAAAADLAPLGIPPGEPTVIFVGRLDWQKGLDWLLQSAPAWLVPPRHLLIVGDGPLRGRLERQTAGLRLTERVHFAGWRSDVPRLLAASRLLVLPSRWEGMPNAVLQAMATGLPVVSTEVEGVDELLGGEPQKGQIVPFGNSALWAEKIDEFLGPARGSEAGSANRRKALSRFTIESTVRAYEDLWTTLVSREIRGT